MDEVRSLNDKSIEQIKGQYDVFLKIGLLFTFAALLTSIFGAFRWAAEIAKEEAKKAFLDPETILKNTSSLLVLTPTGESDEWIRRFMYMMGFQIVKFGTVDQIDSFFNSRFDLILLNVPSDKDKESSKFNDKLGELTFSKSVFYFGKGRAENADMELDGRLSFANAKAQLYGNLINALKLQRMFGK